MPDRFVEEERGQREQLAVDLDAEDEMSVEGDDGIHRLWANTPAASPYQEWKL